MPWLKRLVAGLSPWSPAFNPGSVHVIFVVECFVFRLSLIIEPVLHSRLCLNTTVLEGQAGED
jgi:hypothetical protein